MASIQQSIPNMLGGVSQQPDDIKLPGQVRVAENVFLDPTFGCLKRPPTQWLRHLGTTIPEDSQWFPIFRDNEELYMAVIYRYDGDMIVRVWDVQAGDEITVNISESFQDYAQTAAPADFRYLTIADFTLLSNINAEPSVSKVEEDPQNEALVTIDQVAYNTTYNIDLAAPGSDPTRVRKAVKLEISPSSWDTSDNTDQVCQYQAAQTFQFDYNTPPVGSDEDGLVSITGKDSNPPPEGTGIIFRIVTQCSSYRDGDSDNFISRYKTDVILYNGGNGWRKGDEFKVRLNDKTYKVKVSKIEKYDVYAGDGTASFTTPVNNEAGQLTVDDITTGLTEAIQEINQYDAEQVGNVIRIRKDQNQEFIVNPRGGPTGNSMGVIQSSAADISKLPTQCWNDYRIKISNTEDATADDYFVKFEADRSNIPGPGSWVETYEVGHGEFLNPTSMPFSLIREANRTFTLAPLDEDNTKGVWAGRTVGNSETSPSPSFTQGSNNIRSMFLHRNRLGFITEDACVLSQPGDYFNFYTVSGAAVSDADPIDISASDTKPVSLKDAVSTSKGVVLLGEQAQFSLGTKEAVFSTNTAEMQKLSGFDYFGKVLPQHTGVSVMYATSAGEFTKVMELAVESIQNTAITEETTRAVPRYIPTDIDWSACSPNNDLVLFGKKDEDVYVFRFFNQGNERTVAGWSKWKFDGHVEFAAFKGDDLYLVQRTDLGLQLLKMTLIDGPNSPIDVNFTQFRPRTDLLLDYSALDDLGDSVQPNGDVHTRYRLPVGYEQSGTVMVTFTDVNTGAYIIADVVNYEFTVDKGRTFMVGKAYNTKVTLPRFWTKPDPGKPRADHITPPMVQNIYLDLFNSGAILAQLEVRGYPTREFAMEITDADDYAADAVVVEENVTYVMPVYQRGDYINLTFNSFTPFPTAVTSYSWEGTYNKRGYRML